MTSQEEEQKKEQTDKKRKSNNISDFKVDRKKRKRTRKILSSMIARTFSQISIEKSDDATDTTDTSSMLVKDETDICEDISLSGSIHSQDSYIPSPAFGRKSNPVSSNEVLMEIMNSPEVLKVKNKLKKQNDPKINQKLDLGECNVKDEKQSSDKANENEEMKKLDFSHFNYREKDNSKTKKEKKISSSAKESSSMFMKFSRIKNQEMINSSTTRLATKQKRVYTKRKEKATEKKIPKARNNTKKKTDAQEMKNHGDKHKENQEHSMAERLDILEPNNDEHKLEVCTSTEFKKESNKNEKENDPYDKEVECAKKDGNNEESNCIKKQSHSATSHDGLEKKKVESSLSNEIIFEQGKGVSLVRNGRIGDTPTDCSNIEKEAVPNEVKRIVRKNNIAKKRKGNGALRNNPISKPKCAICSSCPCSLNDSATNKTANQNDPKESSPLALAQSDVEIEKALITRLARAEKSLAWHQQLHTKALRELKKFRSSIQRKQAAQIAEHFQQHYKNRSRFLPDVGDDSNNEHNQLLINVDECKKDSSVKDAKEIVFGENQRKYYQPTLTQMLKRSDNQEVCIWDASSLRYNIDPMLEAHNLATEITKCESSEKQEEKGNKTGQGNEKLKFEETETAEKQTEDYDHESTLSHDICENSESDENFRECQLLSQMEEEKEDCIESLGNQSFEEAELECDQDNISSNNDDFLLQRDVESPEDVYSTSALNHDNDSGGCLTHLLELFSESN